MKVTIYSTSTCTTCKGLMQWFDKQHIKYDHHVADEEVGGIEKLMEVSDGGLSVPFTVIDLDNDKTIKIAGYDIKEFKTALSIQ
jgi:glutaredoxin